MQICSNGDVMGICITCSVYRYVHRSIFLYKVASPSTGLACIIQNFLSILKICVTGDCCDNIVFCMWNFSKNVKEKSLIVVGKTYPQRARNFRCSHWLYLGENLFKFSHWWSFFIFFKPGIPASLYQGLGWKFKTGWWVQQ